LERRQERAEPLDRVYDLSSLSGEVEAVGQGDRSMQQCREADGGSDEGHAPTVFLWAAALLADVGQALNAATP
jgi:hypothetical protein